MIKYLLKQKMSCVSVFRQKMSAQAENLFYVDDNITLLVPSEYIFTHCDHVEDGNTIWGLLRTILLIPHFGNLFCYMSPVPVAIGVTAQRVVLMAIGA